MSTASDTPAEPLFTKITGAQVLGVHPRTLERRLADGSLPSVWRDGRRLIRLSDLFAWDSRRRARIPKSAAGQR